MIDSFSFFRMSADSVSIVKCVDVVPGSSRYCCSVSVPFALSDLGGNKFYTVVSPYEEMGVFYDRIVKVNSVSYTMVSNVSTGAACVADFTLGSFDSDQLVSERVGRYVIPIDRTHVELNGLYGAVVVHQGGVFGVRVSFSNLSDAAPATFEGTVLVNFDFSLVGHSL